MGLVCKDGFNVYLLFCTFWLTVDHCVMSLLDSDSLWS